MSVNPDAFHHFVSEGLPFFLQVLRAGKGKDQGAILLDKIMDIGVFEYGVLQALASAISAYTGLEFKKDVFLLMNGVDSLVEEIDSVV